MSLIKIPRPTYVAFIAILLSVFCHLGNAKPSEENNYDEYIKTTVFGHDVYIDHQLMDSRREVVLKALNMLSARLSDAAEVLPVEHVVALKRVDIFIEGKSAKRSNSMRYYGSTYWLKKRSENTAKVKSIEIASVDNFINWNSTPSRKHILLHELAHAYHDQVLGFSNVDVKKAYKNAVDTKLYRRATKVENSNSHAYALKNPMEYFAELSVTYFGSNQAYPFDRWQLLKYDPAGYHMIQDAWGL